MEHLTEAPADYAFALEASGTIVTPDMFWDEPTRQKQFAVEIEPVHSNNQIGSQNKTSKTKS